MDLIIKLTLVLSMLVFPTKKTIVNATSLNERKPNFDSDLVTNLPGQPNNVTFRHYAGYVNVNETNGRALFYWFYEAADHADEKPLVLWLNGGPGCSSVGYGATQEIGPFLIDKADNDGQNLTFNSFSWNTETNILFLESPIGVGFSYSNTSGDYDLLGDDFTAQDTYAFLHKWYLKFPSYRNRTFYIAGESYAGKYVPELAEVILDNNNKKDPSLFIDLKGILLGNPETFDPEDWKGLVDYAWSHAVVSEETHKTIVETCDFYSNDTWNNATCKDAVDELLRQYKEIDMYSLYTPKCLTNSTLQVLTAKGSSKMIPRIMGGFDPCLDNYSKSYYNFIDVQKALHVAKDGASLRNWSPCNSTIYDNWSNSKESVLPIYQKLMASGLRIWVYSGDVDGRVSVLATRYSLGLLKLKIKSAWRPWYHQKQVGGWVQEYDGLTYATVRGAGHEVPAFKPSESLVLFKSFLSGAPLPSTR